MSAKLRRKLLIMSKVCLYGMIVHMCIFTFVLAHSSNSQAKSVNEISVQMYPQQDKTLSDVIQSIEKQTDFSFSHLKNEINADDYEVNLLASDYFLGDLLREIAGQTDLSFHRVNKYIQVRKRSLGDQPLVEERLEALLVKGKVTDENGEGLPGVTILEKNTSNGTVSDFNGDYTLAVNENAVLVVSFVGFVTEEIKINGRTKIDVEMSEDIASLEEVVVVGYTNKKVRDLTGSISSISSEDLSKVRTESFAQAIQGNVSGVYVKSNSGQPGGGVSIRIRGIGGLNNSEPLYVIDGRQVIGSESEDFNPLAALNPNDIESIEVLKDASSAAIYGARGANGVVIITTKRGATNSKAELSYTGNFGVQSVLNVGGFQVLNAEEYALVVNETLLADGQSPFFDDPSSLGDGTDHFDEITRTAFTQEHQLSVKGGSNKSNYYFSLNYLDQDGVVKTSSFNRVTARFNAESNINDWLKIGNNFGLSHSSSSGVTSNRTGEGGIIGRSLVYAPTISIYDTDGSFAGPTDPFYIPQRTPLSRLLNIDNKTIVSEFNGNIYAQLHLLKGLSFKTNFAFGIGNSKGSVFEPTYAEGIVQNDISSVIESYDESKNYQWSNVLIYDTSFGEHNVTALAGYEQLENNYSNISGNATYSDNTFQIVTSVGSLTSQIDQFKGGSSIVSYFGNLSYNYNSKYYLEGTVRRDGSSRFGENNRWGVFPSISGAWRISEESFFSEDSFIEELKLRGSFGEVGNDKIGDFAYLASISNVLYAFGGNDGSFSLGQVIDALGNEDLKWETSRQANIGVDLRMFGGKWTVVAEYFKTDIEDMLLGIPVAATSGISSSTSEILLASFTANAGSLTNKGFELETSYKSNIGELSFNVGGNITTYNNEVTSIGDNEQIFGASFQGQNVSRTVVGGELGEFYGYVVDGIFQTQAEVDAANGLGDAATPFQTAGTAPGDFKFRDLNGDNVINDLDREVIGSPVPNFTYGLNLDFAYKNFDLSLLWYGVQGADIYNANRMDLEASGRTNFNKSTAVLDAWSGEGTSSTIPRRIESDPNQNKRVSSAFVEDGSFLSLRNIRLGYNLPDSFCSQLNVSNINLSVSAQNYLVFTKYSGFDPEVGNIGGNNLGAGIDNDFYPRAKIISFSLSVNF